LRPNINLGDVAKDTISGFEGVVTSYTTWLNGCVRLGLSPQKMHEGKLIENQVFDIEQLALVKKAKHKADPSGGDRPSIARARDPR
jgi:hypothetical protein